jgi:hypothetical protein
MKIFTALSLIMFGVGCASAQPVPDHAVTVSAYQEYEAPIHTPPSEEAEPQGEKRSKYPADLNQVWQNEVPSWMKITYYHDMLYVHIVLHLSQNGSIEDLQHFLCRGELNAVQPPPGWNWDYDYDLELSLKTPEPLAGVQSVKADLRRFGKAAYCGKNIDSRFATKFVAFAKRFDNVPDPGVIWK